MVLHCGEICFFCRTLPIGVRLNQNGAEALKITPVPLLTPAELKFIGLITLSQLHLQYAKFCFVHNFCTWLQIEVRLTQNEARASYCAPTSSRNPFGVIPTLHMTPLWVAWGAHEKRQIFANIDLSQIAFQTAMGTLKLLECLSDSSWLNISSVPCLEQKLCSKYRPDDQIRANADGTPWWRNLFRA